MDNCALEKLKEAVHFVCAEARGMTLGSIRLSKVIFCADRATFISTFRPMIADSYIRGPQGPYLKELRTAVESLADSRRIAVRETKIGKIPFTEYILLKKPDIHLLSKEERELLRDLTYTICTDYSAREISEATHNAAWEVASDDEHIPLSAQLVAAPGEVMEKDIAWALEDDPDPAYA